MPNRAEKVEFCCVFPYLNAKGTGLVKQPSASAIFEIFSPRRLWVDIFRVPGGSNG